MQQTNPFELLESHLLSIKSDLNALRQLVSSPSQTERKFYTVKETAEKLGVAQITIYRAGQSGKIPTKRIGSRLMIPGSYVDK